MQTTPAVEIADEVTPAARAADVTISAEALLAERARFARRLSTRDQIDRLYRRPLTVRRFYLMTTTLAPANPFQAPPRWFGQYAGGKPAPRPKSVAHEGVAA